MLRTRDGDDLPVARVYLAALSQRWGSSVYRGGSRLVGAGVGIRDIPEPSKLVAKLAGDGALSG